MSITLVDFLRGTKDNELVSKEQIDFLIEEHEKAIYKLEETINDSRSEIILCRERINQLEFKKASLKENTATLLQISYALHSNCEFDHTVNSDTTQIICPYFEESERGVQERNKYLERASAVLKTTTRLNISIADMLEIINSIEV